MSRTLKAIVLAGILSTGIAASGSAQASGCHLPPRHQKIVTVYETVRRPVVSWVVKYDHCGQPYRTRVISWQTVRIPVRKTVPAGW
ncbi:MAG: hypothetical protein RIK87_10535 [Fuerstiella sp.]